MRERSGDYIAARLGCRLLASFCPGMVVALALDEFFDVDQPEAKERPQLDYWKPRGTSCSVVAHPAFGNPEVFCNCAWAQQVLC
jgi:hypothetical protein